ncbi:MAG: hypothetical protein R2697_04605 [Ilumatobacteraceae bacterium]
MAFDALRRIEADGAYANIVLGAMLDRSDLHDQDRRFGIDLVYGTTRCVGRGDARRPLRHEPARRRDRTLLRLGAYQLASATWDRTPPSPRRSASYSTHTRLRQRGSSARCRPTR